MSDIFKEQEKKGAEFNYVQIFSFDDPSIFSCWKSKIRMDRLTKRAKMFANMKGVHQLQGKAKEDSTQKQPSTNTTTSEEPKMDALRVHQRAKGSSIARSVPRTSTTSIHPHGR